MNKPDDAEIRRVCASLHSAVTLQIPDVMIILDSRFPGMPDDEFSELRARVALIVGELRAEALHQIWGQ